MIEITQQDIETSYELYFERIYKFFFYKFTSKYIAEDLTSETFLSFVESAKSKKDIKDIKNYLYGIAKNVFLNHLKAKYKRKEIMFSEMEEMQVEYIDVFVEKIERENKREELINKYILKLPEKQQEILSLRLIQKLDLKEVCEKLGKDMNYVKTTQRRGIANLKKLIIQNQ